MYLYVNYLFKINVTFNIPLMSIFIAKDSGTELEDSGNNTVDRAQYEDLLQEYMELSDTMSNTKRELLKLQDLVSFIETERCSNTEISFYIHLQSAPKTTSPMPKSSKYWFWLVNNDSG